MAISFLSFIESVIESSPSKVRPILRQAWKLLSDILFFSAFSSLVLGRDIVRNGLEWLVHEIHGAFYVAVRLFVDVIYLAVEVWRVVSNWPLEAIVNLLGVYAPQWLVNFPGWIIDVTIISIFAGTNIFRAIYSIRVGNELLELDKYYEEYEATDIWSHNEKQIALSNILEKYPGLKDIYMKNAELGNSEMESWQRSSLEREALSKLMNDSYVLAKKNKRKAIIYILAVAFVIIMLLLDILMK